MLQFIFAALFSMALAAPTANTCDDKDNIYKTCGDQKAAFKEVVARAKKEEKVLFITFGADWCPWCRSLHSVTHGERFQNLLASEKFKGKPLSEKLILYHIGVSHKMGDKRERVPSGFELFDEIARKTKSGEQQIQGIPYLVFYNPATNKAFFRDSGNLETSDGKVGHDPVKVINAVQEALKKL